MKERVRRINPGSSDSSVQFDQYDRILLRILRIDIETLLPNTNDEIDSNGDSVDCDSLSIRALSEPISDGCATPDSADTVLGFSESIGSAVSVADEYFRLRLDVARKRLDLLELNLKYKTRMMKIAGIKLARLRGARRRRRFNMSVGDSGALESAQQKSDGPGLSENVSDGHNIVTFLDDDGQFREMVASDEISIDRDEDGNTIVAYLEIDGQLTRVVSPDDSAGDSLS